MEALSDVKSLVALDLEFVLIRERMHHRDVHEYHVSSDDQSAKRDLAFWGRHLGPPRRQWQRQGLLLPRFQLS